jgi:hypothetical protein
MQTNTGEYFSFFGVNSGSFLSARKAYSIRTPAKKKTAFS